MTTLLRSINLTPSGPAVNVIFMNEFLQVRPDFFTVVSGPGGQCFRHDPQRVVVCDSSEERAALFPDSMGGILKVSTESELERLTQKLLQLPLFFTVNVKRHHKSGNTHYIDRDSTAVIVNSQHPYIQDHFRGLLTEAMELMREGKKFAVEFDFNEVLEDWLRAFYRARGREGSYNTTYRCKQGRVVVTNHGEYSQLFSCYNRPNICYYWACCLPCCLIACPLYVLQRKLRVVDLGGRLQGVRATTFSSNLTRAEMEQVFRSAVVNLVQDRLNQQAMQEPITQAPMPGAPPAYSSIQHGQQQPTEPGGYAPAQPRGPYEQPALITFGN